MALKIEEKQQKKWEIYKELFLRTMDDYAKQGYKWKTVPDKEQMCKAIYDCASTAVNYFPELN